MAVLPVLYKLTEDNGWADNRLWGENITNSLDSNLIFAYTDPLLAVLLNPIHANYVNPLLWLARGEVVGICHGLEVGCYALTTLHRVDLPIVTISQRVRWAILCAEAAGEKPVWPWANSWLPGTPLPWPISATEAAKEAEIWAKTADIPLAELARKALTV